MRLWPLYVIGLTVVLQLSVFKFNSFFFILAVGTLQFCRVPRRINAAKIVQVMDLPEMPRRFPVEIEIWAGSVFVGTDDGLMSFEGGWLHFDGVSTTLSTEQCEVHASRDYSSERPRIDCTFYALASKTNLKILVWKYKEIVVEGRTIKYPAEEFDRVISNWPRSSGSEPNTQSSISVSPHPDAFAKPWMLLQYTHIAVFGSLGYLAANAARHIHLATPLVIFLTLTGIVAALVRGTAVVALENLVKLSEGNSVTQKDLQGPLQVTPLNALSHAFRRSPKLPNFKSLD